MLKEIWTRIIDEWPGNKLKRPPLRLEDLRDDVTQLREIVDEWRGTTRSPSWFWNRYRNWQRGYSAPKIDLWHNQYEGCIALFREHLAAMEYAADAARVISTLERLGFPDTAPPELKESLLRELWDATRGEPKPPAGPAPGIS